MDFIINLIFQLSNRLAQEVHKENFGFRKKNAHSEKISFNLCLNSDV